MDEIRWTAATAGLIATLLAGCVRRPGPTRTQVIDVPKPADLTQAWDVALDIGAADVTVGSKGESLVQGTVSYNVARLKPAVTVGDRRVRIRQFAIGILPRRTLNEWHLQLGRGVPMNLTVTSAASSDDWDLGGLSLRRLHWVQAARSAQLTFSEPNPERLDRLIINAGAALLTVRGLANANIEVAHLNAGAGAVTLVFDGHLSRDAKIILNGGVSSITICSGGNPIRVTTEGLLRAFHTGWSRSGSTYDSPEWAMASGPKLTIQARLGLSVLQLI